MSDETLIISKDNPQLTTFEELVNQVVDQAMKQVTTRQERLHVAAMAMQGLLSDGIIPTLIEKGIDEVFTPVAQYSLQLADALIKELER